MIGVIYWSGTGNTQAMAEAIGKGIADAGQEVVVKSVSEISADEAAAFDKLALGCADMGVEQLEEMEFQPFYEALEPKLSGKKVILFGSYGWGGTWLEEWADHVRAAGGEIVADNLPVFGAPDDAALADCEGCGKTLAGA
ncbi:flavodoxin [Veillonella seminalis]|uniref:flavodoxin n=1 Tax=Veillonella seminalis TaxID=1502943 RepID=UPI0023F2468A|nr:flavodoxin [Veillonella seminalis]